MKKTINHILFLLPIALGCVDKIDLSLPVDELPIIVDGMITDQPGPDTVRISLGYPANGRYHAPVGVPGAILVVTDDTGFVDSLIDIGGGIYITDQLDGQVGRKYQLSILLIESGAPATSNTLVTSTPQLLVEAGTIDTIYYEFTSHINTSTGLSEDGFNVFINSSLAPGSSRRIQWHFFGTYKVITDPSQIQIPTDCGDPPCPTQPLPCSEDCMCCTCWYTTQENAPIVSTPNVLGGEQLDRVFMQYIPINSFTFYERYRVEISQMELSEEVFDFYRGIRKQSDNAGSIFQPPFFELRGNLTVQSGPRKVIGTFGASAVAKRHIYILRGDVPYQLSFTLEPADCRAIAPHATLTIPPYWQ